MPAGVPDPRAEAIWRRASTELAKSMPASTFSLWLARVEPVGVRGSTLVLQAPARVREWIERRYRNAIVLSLSEAAPDLDSIAIVASREEADADADAMPRSLPVNPAHTFERFVIGDGNRLAHSAALAVAEAPGEAYNPLFLHGSPGLGKTHLLGAIANYLHARQPELSVHLTTAERFTSEFVSALRRQGPERFKARYRELDALLIDDVQVLEGKERTEEELFHTFNALHATGKQIVLSSDRPPDALSRLAERLRERFDWGLTVELGAPDLNTRLALLWRLASASREERPDLAALREIATRAPANVRLLEGALTRVLALSSLLAEPLAPGIVRQALDPRERERAPSAPPTPAAIAGAVCAVTGVSAIELRSQLRSPRVARARQLAMFLTRELTGLPLAAIAREFDRDHTTVLHALRATAGRLEAGSETERAVHEVRRQLGMAAPAEAAPEDDPGPSTSESTG